MIPQIPSPPDSHLILQEYPSRVRPIRLMDERTTGERRFKGQGVSPGVARAVALVTRDHFDEPETLAIRPDEVESEKARLGDALVKTRKQLTALQNELREAAGNEDAMIFDAHLLVLEDHSVLEKVFQKVETQLITIDAAFYTVFDQYMDSLRQVKDPYLRERAMDIQDVARRVIRNLKPLGETDNDVRPEHPHVVISHDLTPSDTAGMDRRIVRGFATEAGSPTSHTAIMARSLGIPAVVGVRDLVGNLHSGNQLLIDGYNGFVILNPTPETLAEYEVLESEKGALRESLEELVDEPAETADGHHLILSGNIEFADEVENVTALGGEGVGLYRTEFFYLNRKSLPKEEELVRDYSWVARKARPHSVIIRTLDAGGDKLSDSTHLEQEPNPFLGWRGIRVSLDRHDIFQTQLRAILRASVEGKMALMFPMVSNLEELRQAIQQVNVAKDSLRGEGIPFDESIQIGVMIEVPSAALIADALAREVDFFSIGTNDLIQYTVAVDRVNERVAGLYQPHHPAVIRLIRLVSNAAQRNGIWVGVCGEMAGDLLSLPLLVGLGITELSVGTSQLLPIKRAIRCLRQDECATLVEDLTTSDSPDYITAECLRMARSCYPELLE